MPAVTSSAVDDGENPEGLFLPRGRPHMSFTRSPGRRRPYRVGWPLRCGVAAADSKFCSSQQVGEKGGGSLVLGRLRSRLDYPHHINLDTNYK
jgi:hypothetical protein